PTFALDSTPPRVRLIECTPRSTGVTLRWSAADQEDRGEPQVSLHLRSGEGWEERPLPAGGTASISLPEGSCSLYLSARDRCGNRSGAPLPGEILTIDVGASGPRPLNFSGETFRGGDAHYIFIDPGPAAGGASAIEVRAVSLSGGAPLEIATIPWGQKIILWELPFRSGRYRLELSWREAGGGRRSARSPEAFTIDADPPRLQWDRVPRAVGTEALLSLVSVGGDRHEIEDVRLLRRRREQDPWEELPGEPSIRLPGEGRVEALIATASWEEGEWRIGFTASDSLGNRTSPPLSTPPLRVDHTPVKLPPFSIPGVLVEGLAGIEPPLLAEVPARAELQWLRVGEEPWPVELRWTSRGEGFGAPPVALPPGRGRLLLTVVDEAGNHSWREEEGVEVLPALARPLELFPRPPLPAGSRLLVQIHLREPHPEADGSLLLQLIDAGVADPSEGARRTRASLPISRSSQKIVLERHHHSARRLPRRHRRGGLRPTPRRGPGDPDQEACRGARDTAGGLPRRPRAGLPRARGEPPPRGRVAAREGAPRPGEGAPRGGPRASHPPSSGGQRPAAGGGARASSRRSSRSGGRCPHPRGGSGAGAWGRRPRAAPQ
ncbi:MAG: hypothetical protein ACE5GW_10740, partial [Planctomycetota bacterium]